MERVKSTNEKKKSEICKSHFNTISKPSSKTTKVVARSKQNKPPKTTKPSSSKHRNPISRLKKGTYSVLDSNFVEKCTTPNKVLVNVNVEEKNSITTPPIEASVSPEIQFGFHSKILISNSGATPVCYSAGHILSGVADKRKCRRRGSLKGGGTMTNGDENASICSNLKDSSAFPLLAEASVNWHLSPSYQVEGTNFCLDHVETDILSSRSSFVCVDGSVRDDVASSATKAEDSSTTPICYSFCNGLTASFSSGNKIQTPESDSWKDRCVGTTNIEVNRRHFVPCELVSMSSTPDKEAPWQMWDGPGFGSEFASSSVQIKKPGTDEDVAVSYATTLDHYSVSEMKISWRDWLLAGGVIETDEEFDFCRCLSDEDDIGVEICEKIPKAKDKYNVESEKDPDVEDFDISQPKVLCYEPIISSKIKEKLASHMRDTCAESICTNGVSLVDSADSDWTGCFSNNFFSSLVLPETGAICRVALASPTISLLSSDHNYLGHKGSHVQKL